MNGMFRMGFGMVISDLRPLPGKGPSFVWSSMHHLFDFILNIIA